MATNTLSQEPGSNQTIESESKVEPVSEQPVTAEAPYSIFTTTQKRVIIFSVSLAAVFSPMSTTIYLPSLNQISGDLHVSSAKINLTVTTFLIFQGLAPMMTAGFSDGAGRRPAYNLCFVIYIAANIGLALQRNYAALMVLRCLQSAGSSGTVALCYGVVADLVTSAERGMYVAYTSVATILGPILGPIIGGLIAQYLNWPWIFWFLTIASATVFVFQLLFIPETCRKVVGDGSIPPPKLNQSLAGLLLQRRRMKAGMVIDKAQQAEVRKNYHLGFPNPFSTLVIVTDKEAAMILFCGGLVVSLLYSVSVGIPSQFRKIHGFNEIQLGLVYLPFGAGSLISAFTVGKIIDWNYRRHAKANGFPLVKNRQQDLTDFPIEKARLQITLPLLYFGNVGLIIYGWTLHYRTNLAGPLIMLFIFGYGVTAAFQTLLTLMVDVYPGNAAAATAANNLFRCLLSAGATAVVVPMIDRMGVGWTYTFGAFVWVALSPSLWLIIKWGPGWRKEKKAKQEAKKKELKEEANVEPGHDHDIEEAVNRNQATLERQPDTSDASAEADVMDEKVKIEPAGQSTSEKADDAGDQIR